MITDKTLQELNTFVMNANRSHFLDIFGGLVSEEHAEKLWRRFRWKNDIVGFYIMLDSIGREALLKAINNF